MSKTKSGAYARLMKTNVLPQQLQGASAAKFQPLEDGGGRKVAECRSVGFCDLALDESKGHLFLPISVPFKNFLKKRQQHNYQRWALLTTNDHTASPAFHQHSKQPDLKQLDQKQQPDDLHEAETAASTPQHLRQAPLEQQSHQTDMFSSDTAAAVLLQDKFLRSDDFSNKDGRPYADIKAGFIPTALIQ